MIGVIQTTDKFDREGNLIKEGDTLEGMMYKYKVKYGDFVLKYNSLPFPIKCLGFYIEYEDEGKINVDSFAMLELNNVKLVRK